MMLKELKGLEEATKTDLNEAPEQDHPLRKEEEEDWLIDWLIELYFSTVKILAQMPTTTATMKKKKKKLYTVCTVG